MKSIDSIRFVPEKRLRVIVQINGSTETETLTNENLNYAKKRRCGRDRDVRLAPPELATVHCDGVCKSISMPYTPEAPPSFDIGSGGLGGRSVSRGTVGDTRGWYSG